MAAALTYEKAHLVVAAVRLLRHQGGRAPEEPAIADLLGLPSEWVRTAVRHLADRGVLRVVRTPFEARVELADHTLVEGLPREAAEPQMEQEVRQFLGGKREKHTGLEKLFESGEIDERQRAKQAGLAEKLKAFRTKTPGPADPDDGG